MNPTPGTFTTDSPSDRSNGNGQHALHTDDTPYSRKSNVHAELNDLKSALDALMARASSLPDGELEMDYQKLIAQYFSMRHAARGVAAKATRQMNQGVDMTSDYVRAKPLQSVALAAGAGLLVGLFYARS